MSLHAQAQAAPVPLTLGREQVVHWGSEGHLCGIWTPAVGTAGADTAVLLFNSGVIHRIGPHRLNVKLARGLAARGWPSARLDLGGQGDSRPARDAADYRTQAVRDLRAALDGIERDHGISKVLVFGLCSGAAHAQALAVSDPRVRGIFLLDGYIYPTRRTRTRFVGRMLRAYGVLGFLRRLWRFLGQRKAANVVTAGPAAHVADGALGEGLELPPAAFAQDMAALVARGVDVTLLFTGSVLEYYAYPGQLAEAFPGAGWVSKLHTLFEPTIDHTLTTRAAQQTVLEAVSAWAGRVAPQRPPAH